MVDDEYPTTATNPASPTHRGVVRWRRVAILALGAALAVGGGGLFTGAISLGRARQPGPKIAAEVPVTAMDMLRSPSNNSPAVIADPTDARFVVIANRLDAPGFGCALQVSGDGGNTWNTAAPIPDLPAGADTCYAPEVAFDSNGTLHYLFVGLRGPGNEPMGAFLTKSRDRGQTFTPPQQVLGPLNFGVRMAIDPTVGAAGRMHMAWLHASSDPPTGGFVAEPNPIMAAYSDDGGATFSAPVQVSDQSRARVVAPVLTLGPDKIVHVGYYDLVGDARDYQGLPGPVWDGTWSVVVATSVDGGLHFGVGVVVDDQVVPPERPILIFTMAPPALVSNRARTCAAWTDARFGDADVLLRCSTDRAVSWAGVRRLNDDPKGNGIRQYLPRLSLAPGGRLDAVFLDRRHNPDNDRIDVSYTSSTDGGRSFVPNLRVTREHSSALIGSQYVGPSAEGQHEIGSRLGLLSRRSGALLAWPDSRNSVLPGTEQDIFATKVSVGSAPQPVWARGLGVGLAASGLMAMTLLAGRRRWKDAARRVELTPVGGDAGAVLTPVGRRRSRGPGAWILVIALSTVVATTVVVVVIATDPGAVLPSPQVVDVTMREYRYDYRPPKRGGRVVFRLRNAGTEEHRMGLYLLPDDMPPIDVQLRGTSRSSVDRLADPLPRLPGETESFAVDLVPGQRYALLCFLKSDDKTHAELGMNSEFRPAVERRPG